jgi:hypothetical protein
VKGFFVDFSGQRNPVPLAQNGFQFLAVALLPENSYIFVVIADPTGGYAERIKVP